MTNTPFYLLISIIAFVACAHFQDRLFFNVVFAFIGGWSAMQGIIRGYFDNPFIK